jgi:hypothetical protein
VDIQQFRKNRETFPPDVLARYAGQYVAWSPDGAKILACDKDELGLANWVRANGYDSSEVLIAFVPAEDEVLLGGGLEIIE